MPSPTSWRRPTPLGPRPHLERGLRYEQAGLSEKALESYGRALEVSVAPAEAAQARLRRARVHGVMSDWDHSLSEAREAVRLAREAGDDDLAAEAMNVEVG